MGIRVKATFAGHYGGLYRYPGDVFEVHDEHHFSDRWMIRLDKPKPVPVGKAEKGKKAKKVHEDLEPETEGDETESDESTPPASSGSPADRQVI